MNNIHKVIVVKEDLKEITFYDIAVFHPFIWNNKLYFKISEDVGFNPETREQASLTTTCGVQDCNLEIKIIK